jgi:uncharacterized protein (UPF0332 family)
MAAFAPDNVLLRVAQATKSQIDDWKHGVHLEASTGRTVDELRHRAAADRVSLGRDFHLSGNHLLAVDEYRSAIGRYYYSMYHVGRAIVYFRSSGDDHEKHSVMPSKIPTDFPNQQTWLNTLKLARLNRNRADYEPYPKNLARWEADAVALQAASSNFLRAGRAYLRSKGCSYL